MNKIKYFLECFVPIRSCNFRCSYCYVTQNKWWDNPTPDMSKISSNIETYLTADRFGGSCMVNLCATGETLLSPYSVDIIKSFLKNGHYVMVVTNGTLTDKFRECCEFSKEYRDRLFFKISFHYLELKSKNMLEKFFSNINMVHEAGISFTVELTPDDCYVPYIEEIKQVCMDNLGALCHVTVVRDETRDGFPLMTKMSREDFVNTWKSFDSVLFSFKESIFEKKRKEYCYAGKWGYTIDLISGNYAQCYRGETLGNLYGDSLPLHQKAIGCNCPEGHCFNGHAFLGFGLIPTLGTPYYLEMRDRINNQGEHWIKKDMAEAMSSKLCERNDKDGFVRVTANNIRRSLKKVSPSFIKKAYRKILNK